MANLHDVILVAVVALVTVCLRFLPFWVFGEKRTSPPLIAYLGQVLPYAIMGMLVIYCLKDVSFSSAPFGAPELICCGIVAALHVWKRSTLLSIGAGTICYMLLVQLVF